MKCRMMREDDLDEVLDIERKSFVTPWTREMFLSDIARNPAARYIVLEQDGAVAGYAGMWLVLDEAQIVNVAVAPQYRGKGLSHILLGDILQLAADSGMVSATLEVRRGNAAARRLYRDHKFVEVGCRKGYYSDTGEDAILMTAIDLPPAKPEDDPFLIAEDD